MTEYISTFPLLLVFNISWIISFSLALFVKREKRILLLIIAIISSLLIVNFSTVDVRCVSCTGSEITISEMGVFPIVELVQIHSFGFFPLQAILLIYFFVTDGMNILKRDPKDRE